MKLARLLLGAALVASATPATAQFHVATDFDLGMDDAAITPDGRYGVVRMNGWQGSILVYDMDSGAQVEQHQCSASFNLLSGPNEDGVAVTNDRAIVIGNCAYICDLAAVGTPGFVLDRHDVGLWARDVALTPDGAFAAVRGGAPATGVGAGGLFVFDMATGAIAAQATGAPLPWSTSYFQVDSVAATDEHAVFLSHLVDPSGNDRTVVTVFELRPAGGGPPVVAYETVGLPGPDRHLRGSPNDLAILPDGDHVAIRSEFELALYDLDGTNTSLTWRRRPKDDPGPPGAAMMDSVEVTDDRIVTITRVSNGGFAAQIDFFDMAGNQRFDRVAGDPHDIAILPGDERLAFRTSSGVFLYDLTAWPAGDALPELAATFVSASSTSFGAGLDTVVAGEDCVIAIARQTPNTDLRVWDVSNDTFAERASILMPDIPNDLEVTPDGTRVVVGGNTFVQIIDLRTATLELSYDPSPGSGGIPWSDGVVTNDEKALAWGYCASQCGWISLFDLFAEPASYCVGAPNSVGAGASLHATGSSSVARNDLALWGTGAVPNRTALLLSGTARTQTPFADGFLCVAGTTQRFPLAMTDGVGSVRQLVDVNGPLNLGGAITAGSTWTFQFLYRDLGGPGGTAANATDGLEIDFLP